MWKDLNIQQKSEVMKMAISQGLTDLNEIKKMYDASIPNIEASSVNNTYSSVPYNPSPKDVRYDDGGWLSYLKWKDAIGKYKGIDTNDPAYDYAGFYIENPERAWALLNDNPNAHFVDTYKTVYHPTFSDESMYSGIVSPQYNPEGLVGGSWRKYPNSFTMSTDLYRSPVSMDERIQYLENNEPEGVVLREYDGSLPIFNDGSLWGGVKPTVEVSPYAYGGPLGNIYKGTGNKSQKLSKAERENRAMWAKGQPFYKEMSLWNTGLSDVALAGILGNIGLESGFDYKSTNGTHHGYLQNQDSIRDYIKKYYGGYGHKEQMQYLRDGLTGKLRGKDSSIGKQMQARFDGYIKAVANVTDPIVASQLWEQHYERSKGQAMGARQQYAKHFYDQISATVPGAFRRAKLDGTSSPIKGNRQLVAQVPTVNMESPIFHTAANDLTWMPPVVASPRQEDIAPLLVQNNKPLIVEPLEDTSSTPKDFSAIWDQIFPKVENTQEEFNPLLDPSTQFTALQSRPRYQMKPTPIINMPINNGDNDYMLFKPLAKGGNLFDDGGSTEPNINLPDITVYQPIQKEIPNFIEQAIYETGSKLEDVWSIPGMSFHKEDFDSNGRLKDEERNWYIEHGDIYKNNPLEYSAIRKILDENETKFAVNAFGELVPKSVIMDKARELEHAWRMENDRAYRDKVEHNNETYEQYYDRMQNAPIASNTDLDKEMAWQYDQNDLDKQQIEKNKADRFAAQQHRGLTEAFAAPFYVAATIPGLAAMPAAVGPFLAAHDGEAIVGGILGTTSLIGGLTYGAAKHDEYTRYKNSIDKINSYISTPWVRNAIEQARRDPEKSEAIMKQIRFDWLLDDYAKYENGNLPIIRGNSVGGDGYPQNAFLLDRDVQRDYMLKHGYTEAPGDYGLVRKAVGDRDIPVYQQMPDVITRDKLTPIGNLFNYVTSDESNSAWLANSDNLEHAGDYPTALYVDKDGNFYQKAWDLNDYSGGKQGIYGVGLDLVGNPVVVTTGFQPVNADRILELEHNSNFEPTEAWEEALKKVKTKK